MRVNAISTFSGSTLRSMPAPGANARPIAIWLFLVCAMIFLMVVVGGATRLTESGLSIVTWQPISGTVPPLTEHQWQAEFDLYQHSPQYQQVNKGMDLAGFKQIFWWEYIHRLLGRLIGLVFAVPFLYFLLRGRIRRQLKPHLVMMFILGGCQGLLGWYMVKSGLVNRPEVSHYRLTAHLSLALTVYGYIFWTALGLVIPERRQIASAVKGGLRGFSLLLLGLVCGQIVLGGFVAGLKAGFAYNTWPLMGTSFVPKGLFTMSPWFMNLLDNTITVQFLHRSMAYLIATIAVIFWFKARQSSNPSIRTAASLVLAVIALQIFLGIMTLILVVPVPLATAHQGGAVLVLTSVLYAARRLWKS